MEYANGSLNPANTALIGAYLTMNPDQRAIMDEYEALSASISFSDQITCNDSLFDQTLALLDQDNMDTAFFEPAFSANTIDLKDAEKIPAPILDYAMTTQKGIKFSSLLPGYQRATLSKTDDLVRAELLKIAPGKPVAEHSHNSLELTLILDGAFEDETGYYAKGSLIICDENDHHSPISDTNLGCLCFTTRSEPLKYKGGFGKLLNFIFKD